MQAPQNGGEALHLPTNNYRRITLSSGIKVISIPKSHRLSDLERELVEIDHLGRGQDVSFRIARNQGAHFFASSRLAAVLATASQHASCVVEDWHSAWGENDLSHVYRSSVGSLAAATYALSISNSKGDFAPFSGQMVRDAVFRHNGILEPHNPADSGLSFIGKSLTLCAFDPAQEEPLSLAGLVRDKAQFVSEFSAIKRRHFGGDRLSNMEDMFRMDPDLNMAEYIFELYQNGYEHGRYNTDRSGVLPGLRFISVRKHIAANERSLRKYAEGFPELDAYLAENFRNNRALRYYEVGVSDQGLGILRRFLADRPAHASDAGSREARLELLRRILAETLTSKKNAPGAGGGLMKALRAARDLGGFVSLRTDRFWIYAAFAERGDRPLVFDEVDCGRDLAPIAGTHFNAIFPLLG
jgi:hypothetical protein